MNNIIDTFITNIERFGVSMKDLGFSLGTTEAQINEIERVTGYALPTSFRYFLQQLNGQRNEDIILLPDQFLWFSAERIVQEYESLRPFFDDCMEFYDDYYNHDRVRGLVYAYSRIPIAGMDSYHLYLDFDPAPNGTFGQILCLIDECEMVVLALSFSEYLQKYNKLIENGTLYVQALNDSNYNTRYRLTTAPNTWLDGRDYEKLFDI